MVKAVTGRVDDEPQPKTKRGKKDGERDGGMMRFARRFSRLLGTRAARANALRGDFQEQRAAITQPGKRAFAWANFEADSGGTADNPLGFFHGDEAYQCEEDFDTGPEIHYDAA